VIGHEQKTNRRPSEAALDQRSIIAFIFCRDIGGRLESICLAHRGPKKDQRGGEAERGAPRMQSGPFLDRKKYWRRSTGTRLPTPRNSAVNFSEGLELGRQVAVDLEADANLK